MTKGCLIKTKRFNKYDLLLFTVGQFFRFLTWFNLVHFYYHIELDWLILTFFARDSIFERTAQIWRCSHHGKRSKTSEYAEQRVYAKKYFRIDVAREKSIFPDIKRYQQNTLYTTRIRPCIWHLWRPSVASSSARRIRVTARPWRTRTATTSETTRGFNRNVDRLWCAWPTDIGTITGEIWKV